MTLFDIQSASYRYREVLGLDSVTCAIESGERVAILGANGSGKSTLLRLLDGLYFAQSGSVAFEGTTLSEEALQDENFFCEFRRRVGFVFQNPDVQLFNPTVFDELAFGPLQLRWPKKQIIEAVDAMLERMDLMRLKHRVPHRLSGGEKKRVALASVLMLDPEVLLLDEPTAYLDPKSQSQMIDFLLECQSDKTVITATLASMVTAEELAEGRIYPSLNRIREVSLRIALEVASIAFREGLTDLQEPQNLEEEISFRMFRPEYS